MKFIIEFNEDEREQHQDALFGASYRIALDDMNSWLRGKLKYEDHSPEAFAAYGACKDKLNELRREAEEL
jgi:hypothetical protein